MAVTTLLKLAGFTNELRYVDIARQALTQMQAMMSQYPMGFGQWLQALAYALSKPRRSPLSAIPTWLTRKPCWKSSAIATGFSRSWPGERQAHKGSGSRCCRIGA